MFKIFFGSHICIKSNMVIWNLLAAAEVCIDLFKKPAAGGGDDDLMMPHSNATTGA